MSRILVIEDDSSIRAALEQGLTAHGHVVLSARSGIAGLELTLAERPDVVLLDLGLPDVDGLTMIGMIRAAAQTPVIVITAESDGAMMVRALDAGADDYVLKPFLLEQVSARIRAVVRRSSGGAVSEPIRVGALVVHVPTRTASLAGVPLALARREFDLLVVLARRVGEVITKRELLATVWQQHGEAADPRTVDVHLSWLRRKLGETATAPRYLQTVRGVGVRLVDPTEAS
jgi:DNA-binding response OmpR family regulator